MNPRWLAVLILAAHFGGAPALAAEQVLTPRLHHLRAGDKPEWSDFPPQVEGASLQLRFTAERNAGEQTLRLRQQNVRETWKVLLNGHELGRLRSDENDLEICLPVPAGSLAKGDNHLTVERIATRPKPGTDAAVILIGIAGSMLPHRQSHLILRRLDEFSALGWICRGQ